MSLILAVNSGMGSSAGVFRDGEPVFCIEEERLTRVKNWMGVPRAALAYMVEKGIVDPAAVDAVALCNERFFPVSRESFYRKYDLNFERARGFGSASRRLADRAKLLVGKTPLYAAYAARRKAAAESDVDYLASLGFDPARCRRLDHHFCHAAAAYYGLARDPGREYLVFTLDGGGDGIKSSVWRAKGGRMERLSADGEFSIGNMYSSVTCRLGFTPHEHEYKLMGLAPYVGEKHAARYRDYFSQFLELREGDTRFANPRPLDYTIFFRHLLFELTRDRFDNIAAGLQTFCEEIVTRWIQGNMAKYGVSHILCAGGVFMNVKMNMLLSRLPGMQSMGVFPSCGDETNIFGAGFFLHNEREGTRLGCLSRFCLGMDPSYDLDEALGRFAGQIAWEKVEDPNAYIADQLVRDRIVARCTGPMEFGARALGNRSILANPRNLTTVGKINRAIKCRDFWMPFAPAVLWNRADELLEVPDSLREYGSPYMMFAFATHPGRRPDLACGLHQADFTARAETVDAERYPDFHAIITRFAHCTGVPGVLNTSFNLHGYPIVEGSVSAVEVLLGSQIDVLVINDVAIRRKAGS